MTDHLKRRTIGIMRIVGIIGIFGIFKFRLIKKSNNIENTWNLRFFEKTMIIQVHWNNGHKQNFRNFGNIEM